MSNYLENIEKEQIKKLTSNKRIPAFRSGDTIKVVLKIIEGDRSRLQSFEGICIARKNNGVNSKFTIRKLSHGEGVERVFPLFSPIIDKIEVIKKGSVNRAKLYYLRGRKGKKARITDSDRGDEIDQYELIAKEAEEKPAEEKPTEEKKETKAEEKPAEEKKEAKAEEKQTEKKAEEKPAEEKSKSTAEEADKTKDEAKS